MKVTDIQPIIHSLSVTIDGLKYKDVTCQIEVECVPSSIDDKQNARFNPISASCEELSFSMGGSFWEENFGKRQANRIRKICDEATKSFMADDVEDKDIVEELRDMLEWCETGKDYHQAIIVLKNKIEKGNKND